jgi:MFS family permease
LRSARPRSLLSALVFAGATYAMSQTLLIPSLPEIQRELDTTVVGASTLFSAFIVSGAVTAPLIGRLGDVVGKRRMVLFGQGAFVAGALVCAMSSTLPLLIAGRVLMGTSLSVFPLSFAIIRDEVPGERATSALAIVSATVGIGSAAGQGLGGTVTAQFGYHGVFWVSLLMGVATAAAIAIWVPPSRRQARQPIDVTGTILLSAGLAAPLVAISQTPGWGWGGVKTLGMLAVGAVLLAVFVLHERRHPHRLVHLPTLAHRQVAVTNVATFFLGFGPIGAAVLLSQFFQMPVSSGYGAGASASEAGMYLVPGALLMVAVSPLAGRLSTRAGPKTTLKLGCAGAAAGLGLMAVSHGHALELYVWPAVMYMALGCALGAMPTLILQAVPAGLSGQSAAANLVVRSIGAGLGVQVAAVCVASSVGASGLPSELGFTIAFGLQALAGALALLVCFALANPRSTGSSLPHPASPLTT